MASYKVLISVTQWRFNIQYIPCKVLWSYIFEVWDLFLYTSPSNGLQGAGACGAICCQSNQEHRGEPHSLFDKCTGHFYMQYTQRPRSLLSHPKDTTIMVKCLAQVSWPGLKPTLCRTETLELESDALIRCYTYVLSYTIHAIEGFQTVVHSVVQQ